MSLKTASLQPSGPPAEKIALYLLNKDLRVSDNSILHYLAIDKDHGFTRILPVYVWNPVQIETSGFLAPNEQSPYPEARSKVGGFWRTGPHRVNFTAEAVWNLKINLEQLGSGLIQRIGKPAEVVRHLIDHYEKQDPTIGAVWLTAGYATEEVKDQKALEKLCIRKEIDYKEWKDEKYLIDDATT
ncbi:putative cryptochrome DASH [Escovopsis weberi]|uniref:Putative cryptochrome DASH n=1 Tax=Escovopsis weberi TaxID=150374 RepID=A0A0M8N8W3_ESCWE|nr:putative cryptochrome DASH [Escovopsis weberi]